MIGLFVALGVSGCATPAPDPTPTPTGFATEAEAFAAAEATYRAYIDASNAVDTTDPSTFAAVFGATGGELNASARESLTEMHAEGTVVMGDSTYSNPVLVGWNPPIATIAVCLDVSRVSVSNSDGQSLVSPDRPPIQSIAVDVDLDIQKVIEIRPSGMAGRC
ncbi:hypothetical protein [Microbacterium binotii]|uniref:hypothetical protein n=1 Tax=Microbacterium binotii TaxID=462710 RepID=UPI001F2CC889|nr:hypothetical protein [Microbacterium binotii]UIN29346.1 hypothetical protein LXM64_09215 [Microbacterium binotii]